MQRKREIPISVAMAATQGNPIAIAEIIRFFEGFIVSRSAVTVYRPDGSTYRMVDPDVRHKMETELIAMVLYFEFR